MHARLKSRWRGARRIPLIPGGWYPVVEEAPNDITVRAGGEMVCLGREWLELTDQDVRVIVLACEVEGRGIVGVCPRGHHIEDVGPTRPRARCPECQQEYDIAAG